MRKIDYLDDERKKLWAAVENIRASVKQLNESIKEHTPEEVASLKERLVETEESVSAAEASRSRYQTILQEAEATLENVTANSLTVSEKVNEVQNNAALASSNLSTIQERAQQAAAASKKASEIESLLETVGSNIGTKNELLEQAGRIHSEIEDFLQKSDILHDHILEKERATTELHRKIFGYTVNTDEEDKPGRRVQGLKDQLESSYNELSAGLETANVELEDVKKASHENADQLAEIWTSKHEKLSSQIQELLPKALTAGLSHAYADKKVEEINDQRRLRRTFNIAIGFMVVVSLIPFFVAMHYIMKPDFLLEDIINRAPKLVIGILPLYVPVLWVAYSSNKKLNLSKRLIEEYSHKEVLSRTYEGLTKQIEAIEDDSIAADLRNKLLYNVLQISAENPGKLITDYNKSDHPIVEALEHSSKLNDSMDRLSMIPGFSKLAEKLTRKAQDSIEEEAQKAVKGLAYAETTEDSNDGRMV